LIPNGIDYSLDDISQLCKIISTPYPLSHYAHLPFLFISNSNNLYFLNSEIYILFPNKTGIIYIILSRTAIVKY